MEIWSEWGVSNASWPSDMKEIAEGYCMDCDKVVDIEYYTISTMPLQDCSSCMECNGHNVEFMSPVIEHLIEKIEELIR